MKKERPIPNQKSIKNLEWFSIDQHDKYKSVNSKYLLARFANGDICWYDDEPWPFDYITEIAIVEYKTIIAGGRNFNDSFLLTRSIDDFMNELGWIKEIVCGMCKGADLMGRKWAIDNEITVKEFPANWDLYGKSAGYKRNEQMALYADAAIIFWDGESKGTKHMIDLCVKHNVTHKIIYYD